MLQLQHNEKNHRAGGMRDLTTISPRESKQSEFYFSLSRTEPRPKIHGITHEDFFLPSALFPPLLNGVIGMPVRIR